MHKGTVKRFNESKGFGFIESDEGGDKVVHYSAVRSEGIEFLNEDQRVTFESEQGKKPGCF